MATTRKRDIDFIADKATKYTLATFYNGQPYTPFVGSTNGISGKQATTSSGHPWPPSGVQRDRDIGGDFQTSKNTYSNSWGKGSPEYHLERNVLGPGFGVSFHGTVDPFGLKRGKSTSFPAVPSLSTSQLTAMGSTAIARTIPTNPIAGAAQFLGELKRDGLPSLPGLQSLFGTKSVPKRGSNEYLNFEFAVKPFIGDLQDFAKVAKESEKILKQYKRDSGRNVRRRYEFPPFEEITVSSEPWPAAMPVGMGRNTNPPLLGPSSVTVDITTVKRRKVWFSGCYTYYLDPGETALGKVRRHAQLANKLLGTRITPELIWELTPWSWAVDWQSNVGDVIANYSAFQSDGLVLRYGYIMEESSTHVTRTVRDLKLLGSGSGPTEFSETFGTIQKRRIAATPYGFGINLGGLSPRQWAILVALGISKDGRKVGM